MADYNQAVFFGPKDALPQGDPNKRILGSEVDGEFALISSAISSKFDPADKATLVQAQAGTSDTVLMTPLRSRDHGDARYLLQANNLSGLTSPSTARANLGLGSIATQASDLVSITGGSISGITDLSVADGGTGGSTAAAARTNLAAQETSIELDAIASTTSAADKLPYFTGIGLGAVTDFTPFARTLVDDLDAPTARTTLGLGSLATQSTISNADWSGADLAVANGGTGASRAADARANLELGSMALQNFTAVSIAGGSISTASFNTQDATLSANTTGLSVAHTDLNSYDVGLNVMPRVDFGTSISISRNHMGKRLRNTLNGGNTYTLIDTASIPDDSVVVLYSLAGPVTIAQGTGVTLRWYNGSSIQTGNRTLAEGGVATITKFNNIIYEIWGVGLS